jgi:nicotinamidase-related amidase
MSKRAIIVVDMQNEYFGSGKLPLVGIEEAASNAAKVIAAARDKGETIVHIRHEMPSADAPIFTPGTEGVQINAAVKPIEGEPVICKNYPNAFRETELRKHLDENGIEEVVIVGAMSHMCVDATSRAAADLGYKTVILHDACATRDLEFGNVTVPSAQAHATIMAALAFAYGEVVDTDAFLSR